MGQPFAQPTKHSEDKSFCLTGARLIGKTSSAEYNRTTGNDGAVSRVLVTGGSGFIGRHLVSALVERGYLVSILDPILAVGLPVGVIQFQGSVLDRVVMLRALEGIDCVYHLAGIAQFWTATAGDLDRVNRAGTESVLNLSRQSKVRRVVHCSSETVLLAAGRRAFAEIDETVSVSFSDMAGPYTRSKYLAEQAALSASCSEMGVVIVNPTTPFGPGDHNFTPPIAMLAQYLAGPQFYMNCTMNIVDVRDVALGMILSAERGRPGQRYILGSENVSLEQILMVVARITGDKKMKMRIAPPFALATGVLSEWIATNLTHRPPLATYESVRLALCSMPINTSKARRELEFSPRPAEEALAGAISWLAQSSSIVSMNVAGSAQNS